ncbi:MAG TPA: hypothetical protein VK781_10495 [Solirubrobacteraceae bacterium]|jgi:hypothetical protein|nr:hypothetical protein [Solirubrobacteraceae bacterium]
MSLLSGYRRQTWVKAAAYLLAACTIFVVLPGAASATPANVYVQVNLPQGELASGNVHLGGTGASPIKVMLGVGGELSRIKCSGLAEGELPADSVGAALLALNEEHFSVTELEGFAELEFEGAKLLMKSISFATPEPGAFDEGWQLWVGEHYFNLGEPSRGLCDVVQEGETVVMQASDLIGPSEPYETDTPHIQIEGAPANVVVGQRFTVTVAAFEPALEWLQTGNETLRTTGAGYSVSINGGIPAQTNANGEATLTATAADHGTAQLVARAGSSPKLKLPTADGNSALSIPVAVQVIEQASELSATSGQLPTQAMDTIGAPQSIIVSAQSGGAQITSVHIAGSNAQDFLISADGCTGVTVDSQTQTTCTVGVRFAPSQEGSRSATLVLSSTAGAGRLEVPLTGTGGKLPAGAQGEPGSQGPAGPTGTSGQSGAQGPQGLAGATGSSGATGSQGSTGPRGPAGRDATCKALRGHGAPRIKCTLSGAKSSAASASLTRGGRTYAHGTVASLHLVHGRLAAGRYTLRYRFNGHSIAVAVLIP